MARIAALLPLVLALACAADEPDKTIVASSTAALTTAGDDEGDDGTSSGGEDGSSSGDESSTGDADACPEWCSEGCPSTNPVPWVGQTGLCVCASDDDCYTPQGSTYICSGYQDGTQPPYYLHRLGRCVPR